MCTMVLYIDKDDLFTKKPLNLCKTLIGDLWQNSVFLETFIPFVSIKCMCRLKVKAFLYRV